MPLNLPTTGGDFTPFIKYNAKAGRFFIRGSDDQDMEVPSPTLFIDMANIKTGWILFPLSGPPQTEWVSEPTDGGKWKQGFKVLVYGEAPVGEREWMSNSINCNAAMVKMYNAWEAHPESGGAEKVPWYKFVRAIPISGQYGTNYEPEFELAGFAERAGRFSEARAPAGATADPTAPGAPPTQEESEGLANEALDSMSQDIPF